MSHTPKLLALDFDGVVCDGLKEYFQTSKLTYEQIWSQSTISEDLAPSFYRLRPVIEVGWEMPILLRALVLGISEEKITDDWHNVVKEIVTSEQLDSKELGVKLDTIRDRQIESDLDAWLKLHQFYPGVINKLTQIFNSKTEIYIITTKEGRFTQQLLKEAGVELPPDRIIGKESKQPKHQTLRQVMEKHNVQPIDVWFVEDRLKTLESVEKQDDLSGIGLYLASWGYNTPKAQASVQEKPNIKLLSLAQFVDDFSNWGNS